MRDYKDWSAFVDGVEVLDPEPAPRLRVSPRDEDRDELRRWHEGHQTEMRERRDREHGRARRFAWWTLGLTIGAFTVPVLGVGCAVAAIVTGAATLNALVCARIAALQLAAPF